MEQHHRQQAHAREMFAVIERYLTNTLSQIAFCRQEGLAYSKFNYWLKQYRLREALAVQAVTPAPIAAEKPPADFMPLHIVPTKPAAPSPICVMEFPSGVVIRFHGIVDAVVLAQLIRAEQAEP